MSTTARTADAAGQPEAAGQPGHPAAETRAEQVRLAFASFLMLFVELALIRWVTSNNVYVTKATNFVLLASFLGIGIGFLNARTRRDYLRWTPVVLLVLVGFVLAFPVILASLSGPHPYQGLRGSAALPQPLSLSVVFVLVTAVMAGLGQGVARIFTGFRPLTPTGWISGAASRGSRCSRSCRSSTSPPPPGASSPAAAWW